MAALACEEVTASRLCTATCVAGGTITQLLRASNQGMTRAAPKGDLLLAAALSAAAISATHFRTTKRAAAQRKELIRQPDGRSYTQQAATMLSVAESARCDASVFSTTTGSMGPVVHNLRDSRRSAPKHQQVATCSNASNGNWYFNLALQSSLL